MTTLMTRMFRDRCTRCQVGQGRSCSCRKPRRPLTMTEWWWILLTLLGGFWGVVVGAMWSAWK